MILISRRQNSEGAMAQASFELTTDQLAQIRQWEREKSSLEDQIIDCQRRLASLNEKLKAVAVLGIQLPRAEPQAAQTDTQPAFKLALDASSMTDAVERIVNESPSPISKKELKARLLAENFAEERLGAYFYTVIMRLKQRKRISVRDDGKMWKAASA